jgi:hypothetical protein
MKVRNLGRVKQNPTYPLSVISYQLQIRGIRAKLIGETQNSQLGLSLASRQALN